MIFRKEVHKDTNNTFSDKPAREKVFQIEKVTKDQKEVKHDSSHVAEEDKYPEETKRKRSRVLDPKDLIALLSGSDSDCCDENYRPNKRYKGTTRKRENKKRYKQKLTEFKRLLHKDEDGNEREFNKSQQKALVWSDNIEELVQTKALSKWTDYLEEKKQLELVAVSKCRPKVRSDAIWKKVLRDSRKFYRILFNYYLGETPISRDILRRFYSEIGLTEYASEYARLLYLYFLTDQNKKDMIQSEGVHTFSDETKEENIYKYYNEHKLESYLGHPVYSVLLKSLFSKFSGVYKSEVNPKTKRKVAQILSILI